MSIIMQEQNKPDFSIVISCYYEEKSIDEFYQRLSSAMRGIGRSYEIIFVNDGSTDGTFGKLKNIFANDENVFAVVDLFKNSGQAAAITAGTTFINGKAIITIDSDLQLEPEDIPSLIKKYDQGYDAVCGYRQNRRDSFLRTWPSKIANVIMRKSSGAKLHDFGCSLRIINSKVIQAFNLGPNNIPLLVEVLAKMQNIAEVPVKHHPRKYGKSGFSFFKLFAYNMDNMILMSHRPFQYTGFFCMVLALLFIIRCIVSGFWDFKILDQTTNGLILNSVLISFLILLAILSAVGELVIRNFSALRKKPYYIIKEFIKNE
ncbi:MAG: glycosyltransferase family 2 protein [Phycisphaerae bacterium]|nr:glycosyltransferase family 2 protein [Phycisphaerae bacterium]